MVILGKVMKNSLTKGSVRYLVFKEDGVWYAVGLEFNIVEAGESPEAVLMSLFEAMNGYVISARKAKIKNVLNQEPAPEYEKMWQMANRERPFKQSRTMPTVFTFGQTALVAV